MILLLRKVHTALYLFWNLLFYCLLFPLIYFLTRKPKYYKTLNFIRKIWTNVTFSLSGIFYTIEYEEELDSNQTYVYCPNHASYLDIGAMILAAKGNFHFIGKEELVENWVLKIFFKTIDIPVKRESNISAFRAFKKASENIASGMSLIIFPEGKIPDDYPPVLSEFKNGAFKLAIQHQVPVVPVTLVNNWRILFDEGKSGSRPGIIKIVVHKPIPTIGMKDEEGDGLKEQVFKVIEKEFTKTV